MRKETGKDNRQTRYVQVKSRPEDERRTGPGDETVKANSDRVDRDHVQLRDR